MLANQLQTNEPNQTQFSDWAHPERFQLANGDTFPDFSLCGSASRWMQETTNPVVQVLTCSQDDRCRQAEIQAALLRKPETGNQELHVVQLEAGTFWLREEDGLKMKQSGVVIRGTRCPQTGLPLTRLVCTSRKPNTLFHVTGQPCKTKDTPAIRVPIVADRVPVGSCRIPVENISIFHVGDTVKVVRAGNEAWIHAIGMDNIKKRPNAAANATHNWTPFILVFDRIITAIEPESKTIVVDAPITTAIEQQYGGGYVYKYDPRYRIRDVGVEDLLVECIPGNPNLTSVHRQSGLTVMECEDHLSTVVRFDNAHHGWVRNVHCFYFNHHTWIGNTSKFITVDKCQYLNPCARVEGCKRYAFHFSGQLSLVRDCHVQQARHAFVCDARTCGPNVFLRGTAIQNLGSAETHHRWASGILYDQCTANIAIQDRQWMGSGHGWSGANCIVWNCKGPVIVQSPPTAWNVAVGKKGQMSQGKAAFPHPDSVQKNWHFYLDASVHIPPSLYEYQLARRSGKLK